MFSPLLHLSFNSLSCWWGQRSSLHMSQNQCLEIYYCIHYLAVNIRQWDLVALRSDLPIVRFSLQDSATTLIFIKCTFKVRANEECRRDAWCDTANSPNVANWLGRRPGGLTSLFLTLQSWPKKCVLGCVIRPRGQRRNHATKVTLFWSTLYNQSFSKWAPHTPIKNWFRLASIRKLRMY